MHKKGTRKIFAQQNKQSQQKQNENINKKSFVEI
jgi:hypothetical protein